MFNSCTAHCTDGGVMWPPSASGSSSCQVPESISARYDFLRSSGTVTIWV